MLKYTTSLLLMLLIGCSGQIELQGFDKLGWGEDKDGCNGTRKLILEVLMNQKEQLLGKDQEQIIDLLGKPDKHELFRRSQSFYIYSIDPGKSCSNYMPEKNIANLTLRFNALGLVNEVVFYQ